MRQPDLDLACERLGTAATDAGVAAGFVEGDRPEPVGDWVWVGSDADWEGCACKSGELPGDIEAQPGCVRVLPVPMTDTVSKEG